MAIQLDISCRWATDESSSELSSWEYISRKHRNVYLEIIIGYVQRMRHKPDGLIKVKKGTFCPKTTLCTVKSFFRLGVQARS